MALDSNLSNNPYYDDYTPESNFHRVLFRPATAVQTRELNELQSIMQDQIDKFGRHVFKEGSVIEGCAFTFDRDYKYVKLNDSYSNGTVITVDDLKGKLVRNTNGLEGIVVNALAGLESLSPNLNTIYIKYTNSGLYSNGTYQKSFDEEDTLSVYSTSNVFISNVTVANTSYSNVTGSGYAFTTTEGTIFSKGFFVRVQPQTLIVDPYSRTPNNVTVGFYTQEEIITAEANSNLVDNAAGSKNYAAPGAHRLKLIPNLVKRTINETANSQSFFSLVTFKDGLPVSVKRDPQYEALGKELARRTYEESGDYVVKPFIIKTDIKGTDDANYSTHINLTSSQGIAYVKGYRAEFLNKNYAELRRGNDTEEVISNLTATTFGQYIDVEEFCGEFNVDEVQQLELHNVAKDAITDSTFLSTGYSSATRIGYAHVKGVKFVSGTPGTSSATYRIYLFNVQMDAGRSFKDVRSIINYDSGLKGVADIILAYDAASDSSIAKIEGTNKPGIVYSLNRKGVKGDGFNNIAYTYRNKTTASLPANGNITLTVPAVVGSGTETFPYSGTLSASQAEDFIVVPTANGYSDDKNGTVSVANTTTNIVTGSGTRFLDQYRVGDTIFINRTVARKISAITNSSYLTTTSAIGTAAAANVHQKAFLAGCPIPYSNSSARSITANSTQATISLGETVNNAFQVAVYHPLYRANTTSIKKQINKKRYIKIDCSNNSAGAEGPWCLGLPDVLRVNAVYIGQGSTYSNTGTNYSTSFELDNGQRDNYYDLAKLKVKSKTVNITSNTTILVEVDHFTLNRSQGVGFFNANSYPIDDANTANTTAITTLDIPIFRGSKSVHDLRDSIDFRVFAQNTAVSNTSVTNATINPAATLTIDTLAGGSYLPEPDTSMTADTTFYLPRKDKVVITADGELKIIEGKSGTRPLYPADKADAMTIATVNIPPYPSLPPNQVVGNSRFDYSVAVKISQQRRWTMKDISGINKRIDRLEYYTTLNLLEKSAQDLLVRNDATGLNRFKNGFLVDNFSNHMIGNTLHPKYKISVDSVRSEIRPYFAHFRNEFSFDSVNSTGCAQYGELVLLTNEVNATPFISQPYATKYRNCVEGNIFVHRSEIELSPAAMLDPDVTTAPDIINNYDAAAPWHQLDEAWGTQWGPWINDGAAETTSDTVYGDTEETLISSTGAADTHDDPGITDTYLTSTKSTTTSTTTQNQVSTGTDLNVTSNWQQYNLGTFVNDITILPYIKPIMIHFRVFGMKPNTRVWAYFDDVAVSNNCRTVDRSAAEALITAYGGRLEDLWRGAGTDTVINSDWGDPLVTDSTGALYGQFQIPANTFRSLELIFKLVDTDDLKVGVDGITTSSTATFYANRLSFSKQSTILNIREPQVSATTVYQYQTLTSTSVDTYNDVGISTNYTPPPPPPPPPQNSGGGGCGCSIICTELYRLGLMDKETYTADEIFGEYLKQTDPGVYNGYIKWARHVVSWMKGDNPNVMFWIRDKEKRREIETYLTRKITHRIATPWAEHMQYLIGKREKDNLVGKFIMNIGRPISRLLDKLPKFGKEKASKSTSYLMIGLFVILYYMSKIFGEKIGFPEEINKA